MTNRSNALTLSAVLTPAVFVMALAGDARPDTITIGSTGTSTEGIGAFTGAISFTKDGFTGGADLAITLKNTSPTANGGYITGLVFNIADVPDNSLSLAYVPVAGDTFQTLTNASASPFGTFEFGSAIGGAWLGGSSPNSGVAVGQSRTFLFEINGTGENTSGMSASTFLTNNLPGGTTYPFAVRFRGFADGGSDKVIGGVSIPPTQVVPIPAAIWGGAVLLGALGAGKSLRRRTAE